MEWKARTAKPIGVGDKVCYSQSFLQSTGQYTGDTPFAQGVVTAIELVGESLLATIEWGNPDLPERVNVANLSLVTTKGILE